MALEPTDFPKNPQSLTPYPNFRFRIRWKDDSGKPTYVAGFSRVSGLKRSTHVIRHREGGDPSTTHLAPGQTEYGPITFERGVSYDPAFEQWANEVFYLKNSQSSTGENTSPRDFRKDLVIEVYNEAGQRVSAYNVFDAWVSELQAISDLDANGEAVALFESVTIQNEGWEHDATVEVVSEPDFTLPSS